MGRIVWTGRVAFEHMHEELMDYARALHKDDRIIFEQMIKKAFKHAGAASNAGSIKLWEMFILSILLEQEKYYVAHRRVPEREQDCVVEEEPS